MTHVTLDNQSESVKQFVLSLSADRRGSVIELAGREVLRAYPPESGGSEPDQDWTIIKNNRRCELIDKEIDGTMNSAESKELEELQGQMLRYRHRVAPLPLAHAAQLLADEKASHTGQPSS